MVQIIWDEFLKILKEEAGSQIVETWFKAVSLEAWDQEEKNVILKLPNQFIRSWIQEHYLHLIKTHLSRLLHTQELSITLEVRTEPETIENPEIKKTKTYPNEKTIIPAAPCEMNQGNKQTEKPRWPKPNPRTSIVPKISLPTKERLKVPQTIPPKRNRPIGNINPIYKFDSFVVGPSNSLAHAAAYAVCQGLGTVYNPLFIYGGTGLGKTHLMHALGNETRKKRPNAIIKYVTADHFMHEFISSIRFDKVHKFREKYETVDLLLLDDIQFFSNKEQTQETFFHIFNALHQNQKQIVLSSDTFPKEITGLQSRLKSRMEWGLVADIQTPDLETKIAILNKKAEEHSITLTNDVADFIASRILSNIRALEGALVRVEAFSNLTNQPITIELAKQVLLHVDAPPKKKNDNAMLENILKSVAKEYSVSIQDLRSKKRQKDIARARQVAFYLMKKHTISSLQAIGNYIGGRDHSTVIHAIMKVEKNLNENPSFEQKIKTIEQDIQNI